MWTRAVVGIGLIALAASGQAGAATTTYYRSGQWRAFSGTDPQNRLICGMATGNPGDGRSLEITSVIGNPGLAFAAAKPTWEIPPNTTIPVVIQQEGASPFTAEATGQGNAITWTLPASDAGPFGGEFRAGQEMTISFPSGSEPPWRVLLKGSTAVDDTFRRCIQDYSARAAAARGSPNAAAEEAAPGPAAPTQPFAGAPTQPFAAPGAPPQPPPAAPPIAQAEPPVAEAPPALPPLPPLPQPTQPGR